MPFRWPEVPEPEMGSMNWWLHTPVDGIRGIIDTVLRLLEQEAITRGKAREVVEWICNELTLIRQYGRTIETKAAWGNAAWKPPPLLPFDELNWNNE